MSVDVFWSYAANFAYNGWGVLPVLGCVVLGLIIVLRPEDNPLTSVVQSLVTLVFLAIHVRCRTRDADKEVEVVKRRSKRKKDSSTVPEPPRKPSKKSKRRQKFSVDNENASTMPTHTTVYRELELYKDLDEGALYESVSRLRMTAQQLASNRFPGYAPSSRAVPKTQVHRDCVRCGRGFNVSSSGKYSSLSAEPCQYHPGKTQYPGGPYTCCNGLVSSAGCKCRTQHVTLQHPYVEPGKYERVRAKRQVKREETCRVYALDCEMSYTTGGLELTRIAVVGANGLTIYDTFVVPDHDILDLNTEFSGVTATDLQSTTTTIHDVRAFLLKLLNQDSVLVGHALENDLQVLRVVHDKIVDTSELFKDNGRKRKLKEIALKYLGREIHDDPRGHNPVEDARTAMELVLWKVKHSAPPRESLRPLLPANRPLEGPERKVQDDPSLRNRVEDALAVFDQFLFRVKSLPPRMQRMQPAKVSLPSRDELDVINRDENRNEFLLNLVAKLPFDAYKCPISYEQKCIEEGLFGNRHVDICHSIADFGALLDIRQDCILVFDYLDVPMEALFRAVCARRKIPYFDYYRSGPPRRDADTQPRFHPR